MHKASAAQAEFEAALANGAYRAAWRYAWYLSRTREDAEDLLQDALVQAFLHHGQVAAAAHFTGWLLSIVRRTHLLRLRRAKPDPDNIASTESCPLPQNHADGQTAGLAALPPQLATALMKLPQGQREVLELYYLHELELEGVARVLGIMPAAAKLRLFRARAALRRLLELPPKRAAESAAGGCDGIA